MAKDFSLLTKTFRNDLPEFEKLCATIDEHMPDRRHYVLIDHSDLELFSRFKSERRIIVDCSELLPGFHEFEFMGRRLWWAPPAKLVRGWIYQQLAKIQFVARCTEDAIVLVDSDAQFLRPVEDRHVFDGDRVILFHNPDNPSGGVAQSDKWHNIGLRSFGLPETGYTGFDYISQAVVWSPEIVRAMIRRIENVSGSQWVKALIGRFRFSEYVLYGVFCEQVPGPHQAMVAPTDREICHCSWHHDLSTPAGVEDFIAGFSDHHVAILIQSNLHMPAAERDRIFERFSANESAQG
ncbi:DUF6492 family protein [Alteraurantiacibacter aestuarii]|uniref:Nucleotide-diphospho-sugar transferase domain-containing protein n=1 Tax=Alteraurantiacibacter aestuarii TaxID=650004 RepID=A0A844ZS63_9SPHN|nr:DUF6492 family protein [Alteraurantiacibacter aestuarii]MXO88439.1 hypothetical protein [Alteraurantiacibacter aestuarii]